MPVDRGAIDAQLREIGEGERWWEQREFRDLPHILHPDERIRGIINGRLLGPRRPRLKPTGQWLIVATSQRLLCLKQERFARKQVEIAAGEITRIHQSSRLRAFQITVETPLHRYRIRIPKEDAFRFAGALAPLLPDAAMQRLDAGMESLPRLTGVAAIVSRFTVLASPDYVSRDHVERLEATVERLQHDVERLQQQVSFLEALLQKQADEVFLPPSRAGS